MLIDPIEKELKKLQEENSRLNFKRGGWPYRVV